MEKLQSHFKNVKIVKPYSSNPFNTEVYLVCSFYHAKKFEKENKICLTSIAY